MEVGDLHPSDDYSSKFFIWHEWIQANGPLTSENVFEYFTSSMFYDKQSNNQVLRMQTMHTGMPVVNEAEELRRFTGVEFAVVHAQPPLFFVIHKRERLSPDEVKPLAAFFIMNNRIYQSPDVYTILSNRLLTSLYAIQSTLDSLRTHRPDYTPRSGFVWPIVDPSLSVDSSKKEADSTARKDGGLSEPSSNRNPPTISSGIPKRPQNIALLMNAMHATAAHSSASLTSRHFPAKPDNVPPDPILMVPANRAPATPAPVLSRIPTPKPSNQEPPPKGAPGGGKKKRKRTLATAAENT